MPLKGICNRCGNCCTINGFRCINLEGKIGEQTTCKVYNQRYNNMPITMVAPDGQTMPAFCLHGSLDEDLSLLDLIDAGKCSLEGI